MIINSINTGTKAMGLGFYLILLNLGCSIRYNQSKQKNKNFERHAVLLFHLLIQIPKINRRFIAVVDFLQD